MLKKLSFVLVLSLFAAASASASSGLPGITSESTAKPKVRPKQIIYSGDGSALFAGASKLSSRISWSSWTKTGASGSGANWLDNCMPSCAGGKFTGYPVKLHASRPEVIAGKDVFTRLKVSYTGAKPSHVAKTQTWKLTHSTVPAGTQFFWVPPSGA